MGSKDDAIAGLMDLAIEAALKAGAAIREVYGSAFAVELKSDDSPLTEADGRAHAVIADVLKTSRLPVLSEEGARTDPEVRQQWRRYWLVDPLDGTKEFIRRNGEFTVNIALMGRDDEPLSALGAATPLAGVIYVPVKDVLYFAWPAGGAWRQERAGTLNGSGAYERTAQSERLPVDHQRDAFTIVASRSHRSPETEAFIARMRQEHGHVELASMGSALKICLVAEGTADVYPRYAPTMEWDTAAGHAIARQAGRELFDLTTNAPMRYNKHDLVNQWFIVQ